MHYLYHEKLFPGTLFPKDRKDMKDSSYWENMQKTFQLGKKWAEKLTKEHKVTIELRRVNWYVAFASKDHYIMARDW